MSSSLAIYDLPDELHIAILDLLIGHREALRACSLTCKLWRDVAQQKLFHKVDLEERNTAAFGESIANHPYLVDHIRVITLDGVDRIPKPPTSLYPTNVRLLRLVAMDTSNPWVCAVLSASQSSVRRLSLRDCYTDDIATLVGFLRKMPNLKNVEIERGQLGSAEVPLFFPLDAPDLQSLSLDGGESYDLAASAVVRTFLACPGMYKKLSIVSIRVPCLYLDAFNTFLEAVGQGLRELDLGIGPDAVHLRHNKFPLTLKNCPNLLLFNLEFKLRRPAGTVEPDHLLYVPVLLYTLQSLKLRRVKFVINAVNAGMLDLSALELRSIGIILGEERFGSVRRVVFHVVGGPLLQDILVPYMRDRLGALDRKGVLRCVHEVRGKSSSHR